MSKFTNDINKFFTKYKIGYKGGPRNLKYEISTARYRHQLEETHELGEAFNKNDKEGVLDALVDIVYIALGTAHLMGFDFDEAWKRVHKANMKKVRMKTERSPIDIVKPIGWKPPDLKDLCK